MLIAAGKAAKPSLERAATTPGRVQSAPAAEADAGLASGRSFPAKAAASSAKASPAKSSPINAAARHQLQPPAAAAAASDVGRGYSDFGGPAPQQPPAAQPPASYPGCGGDSPPAAHAAMSVSAVPSATCGLPTPQRLWRPDDGHLTPEVQQLPVSTTITSFSCSTAILECGLLLLRAHAALTRKLAAGM